MAVGVCLAARLSTPFALSACSPRCENRPVLSLQASHWGHASGRGYALKRACSLLGVGRDWRQTSFAAELLAIRPSKTRRRSGKGKIVNDLGGEYSENFDDVDKHLVDFFTYKAVKTVLAQLLEMNPVEYRWLYSFVVEHKPQDSVLFIRALVKEKQELAERVMVTRLSLFNQWVKKYDHQHLYDALKNQNLKLLRERLMQTVRFDEEVPKDLSG